MRATLLAVILVLPFAAMPSQAVHRPFQFEWHRDDIQGTVALRFRVDVSEPSDCRLWAEMEGVVTTTLTGLMITRSVDGGPEQFIGPAATTIATGAHAGPVDPRPLVLEAEEYAFAESNDLETGSGLGPSSVIQATATFLVAGFGVKPSDYPFFGQNGHTFAISVACTSPFTVVPLEGSRHGFPIYEAGNGGAGADAPVFVAYGAVYLWDRFEGDFPQPHVVLRVESSSVASYGRGIIRLAVEAPDGHADWTLDITASPQQVAAGYDGPAGHYATTEVFAGVGTILSGFQVGLVPIATFDALPA